MANPQHEWWAKHFPGSRLAAEFDDREGTNYSGRKPGRRDIDSREAWDRKTLRRTT